MEVRVLGPLEVDRGGDRLDLGGRKQRSVLAVLVLHARQVISPDRLADAVWDGEPPASADTTLRGYVSNLRKELEPDRVPAAASTILRTTPVGYVLGVDDDQIDSRAFARLVTLGRERRASDPLAAVEAWTAALALWRGDPYQDFAYSEFAQAEAARLTELRLSCFEELYDAQLDLGRHDQVVGELEAFCSEHPTRERALQLRMLALYRCGRQADALRAYDEGRERLAEELGIDPSPELRELHGRILRQEDDLAAAVVRDAPLGKQTLTFLLGDVERSTEKLRALGSDYGSVLEDHRRTLLDTFDAHGGRGVRVWGDGVFAAFNGATDALAAAVATQLVLSDGGSEDARRLPVRLGLHTGEATFSGDEYVGLAVHLAARIMDAAHGGQLLVSQATRDLVMAEEAPEVWFSDMGTHHLKDFPDPVRLFQVMHPELRPDFPPLRTRSGQTENLPNRLKSVIGRAHDLERIEATLSDARVITLTGVGGVGKTTLALEVGRRLASRYPDGAWLCELAPIDDADAIAHEIASTLGVERQPGRSMRDGLLAALRQRSSLLILDNCEHLLGPVAELVEEITRGSDAIDVLATSREALGVEGERTWPVRSLSVSVGSSDAVRLFEERARDVRPDFELGAHNVRDVESICTRLDGIPLAIELAAARVSSMPAAQIAKRLEEGFRFLRSGRRGAVDRHRTLHGAINWSYAMLSEAERHLFDRLSVFAGSFTLEAAEECCGRDLPLDVADGLASLVAKSMVDADVTGDEARYSLLETMRQYGQDRLAERGDSDTVLRAHATYFVELMEELGEVIHVASEGVMDRLAAEFDNMRAAHAWACEVTDTDLAMRMAVGVPLFSHLQYPEMFRWTAEAITLPGADDHRLLASALILAALGSRGRDEELEELEPRFMRFADDPDPRNRGRVLMFASLRAASAGRFEEADRLIDEYLRLARTIDGWLGERVFALAAGGMARSNYGNHRAAIANGEEACAVARRGSTALQGLALYYIGEAVLAEGRDLDRAQAHLDRAMALLRDNAMHFWVGVTTVALASLRARHGDPFEALRMFDGLLDRWRVLGDQTRQWVTIRNLAELFGRMEIDHVAAALACASVTSESAPPNVGPQADRLAELQRALAGRMGVADHQASCDLGRSMSDEEVVAYAKAEIARALTSEPASV